MKISCPKCKNEWDECAVISFNFIYFGHMWPEESYGRDYYDEQFLPPDMPLNMLPFCPICFFRKHEFTGLVKSNKQATHMVIKNEFDEYIDFPITGLPPQIQKILQKIDACELSEFGEEQDDGSIDDFNSVWGGAGPDCSIKQGEPALNDKGMTLI